MSRIWLEFGVALGFSCSQMKLGFALSKSSEFIDRKGTGTFLTKFPCLLATTKLNYTLPRYVTLSGDVP